MLLVPQIYWDMNSYIAIFIMQLYAYVISKVCFGLKKKSVVCTYSMFADVAGSQQRSLYIGKIVNKVSTLNDSLKIKEIINDHVHMHFLLDWELITQQLHVHIASQFVCKICFFSIDCPYIGNCYVSLKAGIHLLFIVEQLCMYRMQLTIILSCQLASLITKFRQLYMQLCTQILIFHHY